MWDHKNVVQKNLTMGKAQKPFSPLKIKIKKAN